MLLEYCLDSRPVACCLDDWEIEVTISTDQVVDLPDSVT